MRKLLLLAFILLIVVALPAPAQQTTPAPALPSVELPPAQREK